MTARARRELAAERSTRPGTRSPDGRYDPSTAPVDAGLLNAELLDRVRVRLAASDGSATPATLAAAIRAEAALLPDAAVLAATAVLRDEIDGAGPLEPLLRDPEVTDVLVNGPQEVWVERGGVLRRVGVRFADEAAVRRLAHRMARLAGRRLDDAAPWVDAQLPDGTRLHALLAPLAVSGTCLSLRVPRPVALTLDDWVRSGGVCRDGERLLRRLVASRLAFLVSGATGSGKTTLLATLLGEVPPTERIVIVEEAHELAPDHPHVVALEARRPNVEGAGGVTVRDLVRQALRMRPDRLVVGEVRGPEVVDLLAALNTGHEGGAGTVHANSVQHVPARIEALATAAGLQRDAAHSQLSAAVTAVVHLRRDSGRRRVCGIGVLRGGPEGVATVVPAWARAGDDGLRPGPGARDLEVALVEAGS